MLLFDDYVQVKQRLGEAMPMPVFRRTSATVDAGEASLHIAPVEQGHFDG